MTTPQLPPAPVRMDADVLHDGVRWRYEDGLGAWGQRWLVAFVAFVAAGLVFALFAGLTSLVLLASLPVAFLTLVALRTPYAIEVRVTDRLVTVDVERAMSRHRTTLRLDELDVLKLTDPPELGGSGQVVLRADEQVVSFGRGQPRDHAAWMVHAIEVAESAMARREDREGREYTFLRRTPEEVAALRDTTEPEG